MTIYFAGGAEAWYDNTTNSGVDLIKGSTQGATGVANRSSGWAQQDGSYSVSGLIDANGEDGSIGAVAAIGTTGTSVYYSFKMQLPSSLLTPAQGYKVFQFNGSGAFANYHFAISAAGNVELRDASSIVKATWSSPGFTADVPYWWLVGWDGVNGIITLWVGREGAADQLSNANDWVNSVLTYTDATQTGNGLIAGVGPNNYKLNNANGGPGLVDSYVLSSDKPMQPRVPRLAQLTGDGNYSGGSTSWTKNGGGAATYTVIDDPVSAAADETDYIEYPVPDGSGDDRFSALISSSTTLGITTDTILAVIPFIWIRRKAGSSALPANNKLFLRYSGTDLDGSKTPIANSTTYSNNAGSNFWEVFNTPPGGGSWSTTVIDGLEIGIDHNDTSAIFDTQYEIAWMGAYVITEKPTPGGRRRGGIF